MRTPLTWLAWAGIALATLLAAPRAHAVTPEEQAAAQALFEAGRALMRDGKLAEACPKLEASQRLDPGMGTQYRLAECYEGTGRTASAWASYLEVASQARAAGKPDRERVARAHAAALESKLCSLVITVADPVASVPGLEVRRNGAVVRRGQLGVPVPIDPGSQLVEATAPGRKPWRKELTVAAGSGTTTVALTELEAEPPHGWGAPAPSATTSTAPASKTAASDRPVRSWQRPAALAAMGLGVAGVGAGAVLGALAISKYEASTADKHCDTSGDGPVDVCDAQGLALRRRARSLGDASTVAFVAGAALGGAGIVLFLTAPSEAAPASGVGAGKKAALSLSLSVLGVSGRSTW